MNKKALCAICVLMMFSCGVVKQQEKVNNIADAEELFINDSLKSVSYFTEGLKNLLLNNDPQKASENFKHSLELDSTSAATYYQLASSMAVSSPDSALIYSQKSVSLDTTNVIYKNQLGQMLIINEHYPEAMRLYEKLLSEEQQNPNNYRMLAALYDYNKQPFTAIAILDSAEYKIGRLPELAAYKQQLLMDVKLYDKAIAETQALIEDNPYDVSNYVILGNLYGMTNKDSLAVVNYQKSMQIDSTDMQSLASQLDFYRMRNRNNEYLSVIRKVFAAGNIPVDAKIKLFSDITINKDYYQNNYFTINNLAELLLAKYPNNVEILKLYTTHLIRSGKIEQALELYKNHIQTNNHDIEAYYSILDMESYLQRADSVEKYVDEAISMFPNNSELYMRKGYAEQNINRNKEALKSYKVALENAKTDSVKSLIMTTIGDLYYSEGNPKKCFAYYEKALKLDSENAALLNNYAYFMCESGEFNEKTLEMSKKACRLAPNNSTYLDTWGWILYMMGRTEEAKKVMQQAISFDSSKNNVLFLHYGDILFDLGDKFLAEFYWKQALENGYDKDEIGKRLEKLNEK